MKRLMAMVTMLICVVSAVMADEKGHEIAQRYYDRVDIKNTFGTGKMTIIDATKNQKVRVLEMYERKVAARDNAKDSFIRFLDPADIKNTKFLTIGNTKGDDDQRLYLPATKSTRKISSSGGDGKFMSSDFFYYDLQSKQIDDFEYTLKQENVTLANKAFAGKKFYVLEQIAKDPKSPYAKALVWVDMNDDFVYQTEAYDKSGKLWKTMYVLSTKMVDNVMVPTDTLIVNVKDNSKTRLQVMDVQINKGVPDDVFTIKNLEK